ncbi:MAG: hypothetical protein RL038_83 [Actinomycetota bacterium]
MTDKYLSRSDFQVAYNELEVGPNKLNAMLALSDRDGQNSGDLSGIAIAIKDNIEAVGLPASAGSRALTAEVKSDAPIVTHLLNAGAQLVGSTNLSEWANIRSTHSTSGWSAVGGLVGNPWALDRSAGGSSAGSGAAVAAGLVSVAIGTETDGSIVCPASLNGVVGLKPTVGSVSSTGIVPVSLTQDTAGPIAVDVSLAARTFAVIANQPDLLTDLAAASEMPKNLRIGVATNWLTEHAATDAVFERAIKLLEPLVQGIADCDVPAADAEIGEAEWVALMAELQTDLDTYLKTRRPDNPHKSLAEIHAFNLQDELELKHFGQECFDDAIISGGRSSETYKQARNRAHNWAKEIHTKAFGDFDLLVAPTYGPAWKSDLALGDRFVGGAVTSPAAIAGTPLLCLPMGLVDGLPVGLTIAGPANSELQLLALGLQLEKVLGTRRVEDGFKPEFRLPIRG